MPPLINLDDTPTEQDVASSDGPTTLLVDHEPAAFVESPPPVQIQLAESTAPSNSVGSPLPPQLTMASSVSLEVHSSPPCHPQSQGSVERTIHFLRCATIDKFR